MANDIKTPTKWFTFRNLVLCGFSISTISALAAWVILNTDTPALESAIVYCYFFLMLFAYAYILAEPKEGRILSFALRLLICLGIVTWFLAALAAYMSGYGGSSNLTLRFTVFACSYPLTTLITYLIINKLKNNSFGRTLFTTLCLTLPVVHIILAVLAARL